MTRVIRSRRAGPPRAEQPLYARALGLHYLAPSGFLCFVFLEGAIVLGILLALAELVSWWGVLVLPATVALMVKLNDVVAGQLDRRPAGPPTVDLGESLSRISPPHPARPRPEVQPTTMNGPSPSRQWANRLDARQQWARQSATRRYE